MEKLISIIVPVYNVENYLKPCLESILKQTYSNYEIILVDDGSMDESGKICDFYEKNNLKIKVIHKTNGGLSSARNAGLKIAKGDYVVFIDSDDIISVDFLSLMLNTMFINNSDIIFGKFTRDYNDLMLRSDVQKYYNYSNKECLEYILIEKYVTTSACGTIFKKELLSNISFPEHLIYEDYATVYKIVDKANIITYLDIPLYYYRSNPKSITGVQFNPKRMDYFKVSEEIYSYMSSNHPDLCKYVKIRGTRYAISFFKQISESMYSDQNLIFFLHNYIKQNILLYLFSSYKITSKLYGVCISLMPNFALKLFRGSDWYEQLKK